jgi:hypothetical protein
MEKISQARLVWPKNGSAPATPARLVGDPTEYDLSAQHPSAQSRNLLSSPNVRFQGQERPKREQRRSGPEPTRANEGARSALGGKAALGRHNVEA